MATIRILIYTDTSNISDADEGAAWGVTLLKRLLKTHGPAFAKVELRVANRFSVPEKPDWITPELLDGVDQLWIFGTFQRDSPLPFDGLFGGRDNELNAEELRHLGEWMRKGGVLISGDHANPDPALPEGSPAETYLGLGRALGREVPRAGKLRKWVGPPTLLADSSFSTIVNTAEAEASDPNAQEDATPQKLVPVRDAQGAPHRLFMGKDAEGAPRLLDLFPDHGHEGLVILPEEPLDEEEWPSKHGVPRPTPAVIAHGCDKRTCRSGATLAAYDGDDAGVGRVVADSSWHHYFNDNLKQLKNTEQVPTADLLGQFYANLAVWLAPLEKRREMSEEMFAWIAGHPEVKEERGNEPTAVGKVALKYLLKAATPCEILELIHVALPDKMRSGGRAFNFPRLDEGIRALPPLELVVGSIIARRYAAAAERFRAAALDASPAPASDREIIAAGVAASFRLHSEALGKALSAIKDSLS